MRMIAFGITILASLPAYAQIMSAPDPPDVGIDQKLGSQIPLNLTFRDESGADVMLADLIRDKPVVLSLVYYECPMLCNEIMRGELKCFNDMKYTLGDEFVAICVSIDPDETAVVASAKKKTYAQKYKDPDAFVDWHFLTGDEGNIKKLADAVGYRYHYLPSTGEFAHGSAIMVVTPHGKVARYFYGIDYVERDVRFGLMEAADERLGSLADELLLLCYHYDPATGTYGAFIFGILRIAGVATVLGIVALVGLLLQWERRAKRRAEGAELVNGHAPAAGPTT